MGNYPIDITDSSTNIFTTQVIQETEDYWLIKTPIKELTQSTLSEEDEGEFEVTVQMIVDTLAHEFPEFVMIMAEENWVRGYQQGLDDATRLHQTTPADA